MLTSDCLLVHYDPDKEIFIFCDASPYGVVAVNSHRLEDVQEKHIAFASWSLAPAECTDVFSQLEKEGLAIFFGAKCFHQYLFGRHFTIASDQKPLHHLFREKISPYHGIRLNSEMGSDLGIIQLFYYL